MESVSDAARSEPAVLLCLPHDCGSCDVFIFTHLPAIASLGSFGYLRAYCFPRYIIQSALVDTTHLMKAYSFVGDAYLSAAYATYIVPLVVLWLLSCMWLLQIAHKLVGAIVYDRHMAKK